MGTLELRCVLCCVSGRTHEYRRAIDYKTHILIAVRAGGVMAVIADWPYVPPQSEVQQEIDCTREAYVTFMLCTPTSIMPAERDTRKAPKSYALAVRVPGAS